ncbi:MAG: hypothetical protein KDA90_22620 [Planctomycetaceae bacterium]|nr:hypothetical protein [Planctomycetaceae bacterium]
MLYELSQQLENATTRAELESAAELLADVLVKAGKDLPLLFGVKPAVKRIGRGLKPISLRGPKIIDAKGQPLDSLPANSITASEAAEIQAIANKYNTAIDVVGSRAANQGRNVGTNLPAGKGPGTRSDIDFRIDAAHPEAEALIAELRGVGNNAGTAGKRWSTNPDSPGGRATEPPYIRFTPD